MMGWLELFHKRYHWSEKELMESDLSYVFTLYAVKTKLDNAHVITPIDESGLF